MRHHQSQYSSKQSVAFNEPVNPYYWTALDYCSSSMSDRTQNFDEYVESRIAKMELRLEVHLKLQILSGSDPIRNLGFLPTFQMAFSANEIRESAEIRLFYFFMKKPARAAIDART